ncbi:MAG: MFS transporter [Acidimicrobiia bacterium]|nr:MFS transporter [Acidimicrobiia bacterium]
MPLVARAPVGLVAALLLVRAADEFASFLPTGAFASLQADLGIEYRDAGLIFAAMAVGSLLGSPLAVLVDHRSRCVLASLGAFGYAASLALFAMAPSLAVLLGAAMLLGAASDLLVGACEVALADLAGEDLERELSRSNLLASLGDLAGPALFVAVGAAGWSWRVALTAGALAMALYGAWLATLPFPPPHRGAGPEAEGAGAKRAGRADSDATAGSAWRGALGLLRDPGVWWLALVSALFSQLDEAYFGFLVAFLTGARQLAPPVATAVAAGTVVGSLVGFAVLVRRPPGGGALLRAALAMAVSGAVVAVVPGVAVAAVAAVAFGAGVAVFWVSLQAQVLRHREDRAGSVSTVVGILEQPGVLLPVAIGALADGFGLQSAMVAYAGVPAVLALLVGARARRAPRGTDRPGARPQPR